MTQRYAELRCLRPFYTASNRMFGVSNTGYGDGRPGLFIGTGCGYGNGYGNGSCIYRGLGDGYGNGKGSGHGKGRRPKHWLRGVVYG